MMVLTASSASSYMRSEWMPVHCSLLCKLRDDVGTFTKYEPPLPSGETLTRKKKQSGEKEGNFRDFSGYKHQCAHFTWNEFHLFH